MFNINYLINRIFRKIWFYLNINKYVSLGNHSFVDSPIKITPNCISFGSNVKVFKFSRIEGVTCYNNTKFSPKIIFENNVSIQQNLHLTCAGLIKIGENTAVAANVTITDIHHNYDNIDIPIENQDISVDEVIIGKNCKIYNNVIILPGSKIGNHVTVGGNSVVNGIIPDYCVVVGSPAKIIKRYNHNKRLWMATDHEGNFI